MGIHVIILILTMRLTWTLDTLGRHVIARMSKRADKQPKPGRLDVNILLLSRLIIVIRATFGDICALEKRLSGSASARASRLTILRALVSNYPVITAITAVITVILVF